MSVPVVAHRAFGVQAEAVAFMRMRSWVSAENSPCHDIRRAEERRPFAKSQLPLSVSAGTGLPAPSLPRLAPSESKKKNTTNPDQQKKKEQ
ncbi:hypothetical protein NDU88_000959 [Pleurodeles waltl]|uniref:Uncharacterized protein n=1 Tax=Pleurodeles waltl TaxID=8319 RepID=A0AAV7Q776_PLEWA|nr:hypothetical protein NDU88_000959 [Pleurodeles waltl]